MKPHRPHIYVVGAVLAALSCSRENTSRQLTTQIQPIVMASGWVSGSGWPSDTMIALNSLHLRDDSMVIGNVAVIRASAGPFLAGGSEAVVNNSVELKGNLRADSIDIRDGGRIFGNASYNSLLNRGTIDGTKTSPLALPLSITVPTVPNFTAGTQTVTVTATQTLAPGSYGNVSVRAGSSDSKTVLRLSGGVYALQSLTLSDHSRVECNAACELRIKGRLSVEAHGYIGPSATSGLLISAVQVIVEGLNGGNGSPSATPLAAELGANSELKAFVFVPNGTLHLKANSNSVGKFIAKDLDAGNDADVRDGTGIVMLPGAWVSGLRWPNQVLTALNSFDFNGSVRIAGDVAVITAAGGAVLSSGYEASLGPNSIITGNLSADSVIMRSGSKVTGTLTYNNLNDSGGNTGSQVSPLALPLAISVPAFPAFSAGTTAVDMTGKSDRTLAAGSYGLIKLRAGSTSDNTILTLSGGIYNVADIDVADNTRIQCSAACEIRVKNRIAPGTKSFFGPTTGSGLDIGDVRIFVEGKNSGDGAPATTPYAAVFGQDSSVSAFVFVPNGTLHLRADTLAKGRFVARDVIVNDDARIDAAGAVITAPQITQRPANVSVLDGQSATFSVVAVGSAITFRWQRNGVDIPGATAGSYTLPAVTFADNGATFRVIVTNAAGSVTSNAATLTVNPVAPAITTQPQSLSATEGQPATFSCAASGTNPNYQWKKNGQTIAGATSASYTIPSVTPAAAGTYTCVASNTAGSATSNPATLTINLAPPTITTQPSDANVLEGQTATFMLVATGTERSYQWRKNGLPISGEVAASLSLPNVKYTDASSYDCVVSNSGGNVISRAATLVVHLLPPVITQSPASQTVNEAATANFGCFASGSLVSYRWQKEGIDLPGAAGASLSITASQITDAGSYRCVATNSAGSAISNAATLSIRLLPPVITSDPSAVTVDEQKPASFSCSASGTQVSYRWQRNGQDIAGASGTTFSLAAVTTADAASYRCVATNSGGNATSQAATLTVRLLPPLVTQGPSAQTVMENAAASFSCTATGTQIQFQWQKDGNDVPGATGASYSIAHVHSSDAGAYRCVVTNSGGSATSADATLTVRPLPPTITAHPVSKTVDEHAAAMFSCTAQGSGISYRWQKAGQDIAGADSNSFSIAAVELANAGDYACIASNETGSATSHTATLTVRLLPPVITSDPASTTVTEQEPASFSCAAAGTQVSYRWQKNGVDLPGIEGATIHVNRAQHSDAGQYRCVASNTTASATSQAATLTVRLLPPVITAGPSATTVTEDSAATFSCSASGTLLEFRWQKDNVDLPGATEATLTIAHARLSDAGAYRCVVTNSGGSVNSDPAALSVRALPPTITSHPASRTVDEHAAVSFSCNAQGSAVQYHWEKAGQSIASTSSNTLAIPSAEATDAGNYSCVATNEGGSATSQPATLTVKLLAPAITTDPASLTVTEHTPATFSCAASGTQVTYRWQKNGQDIEGSHEASFVLASTEHTDAGQYRCIATNATASATSQAATLTVQLVPPQVSAGPLALRVYERQTASFHCSGTGTLLSYQWQKDEIDLPSATSPDLSLVGVGPLDTGDYRCAIRNSGGTVFSQPAHLTIDLLPPSFPQQPSGATVTEGDAFALDCPATGTAIAYQWSKDGAAIGGATQATYQVQTAQPSDAGSYTCTATNSTAAITSQPVAVVVRLKPPLIVNQPADIQVDEGQTFGFSVSAQGSQLSYQWLRAGVPIPGATSPSFSKSGATQSDDAASYSVVVSNTGGSVTSRSALVHVADPTPPALSINGELNVTVTDNTITLSGSAVDTGSGLHEVTVINDRIPGQNFGVVIDTAGAFSGDIPLALGNNTLTVIARDAQGNETRTTVTVVVQATELPKITIEQPANGANVQSDRVDVRGKVRSSLPAQEIKLLLGSETQFPTGTGPEYAFAFEHVRLIPGSNLITVAAQSTRGNSSSSITVNYGAVSPPPSTPLPPVIELQVSSPDIYLVTDTVPVAGQVRAQRCVQSVSVNGSAVQGVGSGTTIRFSTALSFAAQGSNDLTVQVRAVDCDGTSATRSFTAHRDDGAPVITLDGLAVSPTVNRVTQTPYRLSGTLTDRSLAGLGIAGRNIAPSPTGVAGQWTFQADLALARQIDTPIAIEAWDSAGQHTTREIVLRLDTPLVLEVLAPADGIERIVGDTPLQLDVTARAIGLAADDTFSASFDSGPEQALNRAGNIGNVSLNVAAQSGTHRLAVQLKNAQGATLAERSISLHFKSERDIPLQVTSQEPAADSSHVEANLPITLHFNRPVDPSKLHIAVVETAHGKLFVQQPNAADITTLSGVEMADVDREREPVLGNAQNLPGNRMIAFYPSQDYAYGGTVFVDVKYDGADLWHSKFAVRPLPTLVHGFIANHMLIPLQGIELALPELGRTAVSNEDGNWNFGFGDPAELRIVPGRYRALVNPARKNERFGSVERFIEIGEGFGYAGTFLISELNSAEPFRHIASLQPSAAVLARGDVELDLSRASLSFPDGLPEGDVHVQFLAASEVGHSSQVNARPDWAFGIQPAGIQIAGELGIRLQLPKRDDSFDYIERLPDRVLLVGLDAKSLQIAPVGVLQIDRSAQRAVSVGPVNLTRLDYIGFCSLPADAELLQRYVAGQLSLAGLIAGVDAP